MLKPSEKTFIKTIDKVGKFIFIYPNLKQELEIDAVMNQLLLGNENPTVSAGNIAHMMGTLSVVIQEAPKDWNVTELYDYDEMKAVYDAYAETVSQFRSASIFRTAQTEGVK